MGCEWSATIDDLRHVEGKAELVNGELVLMPAAGYRHGRVAGRIYARLASYEERTRAGYALPDSVGFIVNLEHRRSFSPDAAFVLRAGTDDLFEGPPAFAAEVRSPEDFGPVAERKMAGKRADYLAAGTLVVWDVDPLREFVVRAYRASDPSTPIIYRRGDIADAEPAVPGWSMSVDDLFLD